MTANEETMRRQHLKLIVSAINNESLKWLVYSSISCVKHFAQPKTHFEIIISSFFLLLLLCVTNFHFVNYYACELRIFINIIIYFILRLLVSNIWCGACLCAICIQYYKYVGIKFINEKHFSERARDTNKQRVARAACRQKKSKQHIVANEYEQQQRRIRQPQQRRRKNETIFFELYSHFLVDSWNREHVRVLIKN